MSYMSLRLFLFDFWKCWLLLRHLSMWAMLRCATRASLRRTRCLATGSYRSTMSTQVQAPQGQSVERVLSFLVCPISHAPLRLDAATSTLHSEELGVVYDIRDAVPIMDPRLARMNEEARSPSG